MLSSLNIKGHTHTHAFSNSLTSKLKQKWTHNGKDKINELGKEGEGIVSW